MIRVLLAEDSIRELAFLISYSQFTVGTFIREAGPAGTIHFVAVEATV